MTDKNWLIRTKNNHILGPVSKGKIQELISSSSIKGDDEVCSGNGYWFFVRENELVEKYINTNHKQDFNPVQEASASQQSVIDELEAKANSGFDFSEPELEIEDTAVDSHSELPTEAPKEENRYEINTDGLELDQPEEQIEEQAEDITLIQKTLPKELTDTDKDVEILEEVSDVDENPEPIKKRRFEAESEVKAGAHIRISEKQKKSSSKTYVSSTLLYIIALLFLIVAVVAFYFKKQLIEEINSVSLISIVSPVYAQSYLKDKKKTGMMYSI